MKKKYSLVLLYFLLTGWNGAQIRAEKPGNVDNGNLVHRSYYFSHSPILYSAEAKESALLITGQVTDEKNEPLIGASIFLKGTSKGTVTNAQGLYTLELDDADKNGTLVISYVGFDSKEIAIAGQTTIDVQLSSGKALDEVVVVAYGAQKKSTLTGSIATVKAKDLTVAPFASVTNAIVGRLPGLVAKQTSGQPGSDAAAISIRGFGNALVIVDGVESSFNNYDASQIESITILKDGAASIYGARAGNGVILVTTKRGGSGKPVITANLTSSLQGVTSMMKPTSAAQLAEIQREIHLQGGNPEATAPWTLEQIGKYKQGNDPLYPNTDWYDVVFRDWAPQQQHNISVRGGSEKIRYYGFVGYTDQETMIKTGGGGFKRYNAMTNIDASITDDLTMRFDFSAAYEDRKFAIRGLGTNSAAWQDLYTTRPWFPSTLPDQTRLSFGGSDVGSVYASTNMDISGYDASQSKDLKATLILDYKIRFIKGLSAKALVNYRDFNVVEKRFQKPMTFYTYNPSNEQYTLAYRFFEKAQLTQVYTFSPTLTQNYSLNYENAFGKHRISALGLYESIEYRSDNFNARRIDFLTPSVEQLFAGSAATATNGGSASEMGRKSFVGKLNYSFNDKYLLEGIFRADASARFPENKRWGYFPSLSLGWVISKESFMSKIKALDNLKIRASHGQSGNDAIGNFQYLAGYNFGDFYAFNGVSQQGLAPRGIANPLLTWEKMAISNLGLDFSLFERKIYGEFDVFYRERTGIPATRITVLPSTFGAALPLENLNSLNDRGFEFMLGTTGRSKDFTYDISANISWARSKWGHFEEPVFTDPDQKRLNQRSGQWTDRTFGYLYDGLFTSLEEIKALPYDQDLRGNTTLRPGDVKYLDVNGDKRIDFRDQVEIGRGTTPRWIFGTNINLSYKNFDFSALVQGAFGYSTNANLRGRYGGIFSSRLYEVRWTETTNDKNALIPRLGGVGANRNVSDYYIKDAAYARLKTFAIGYSLPKRWLTAAHIQQFRVYVSGTNMLTWNRLAKYLVDPEAPLDVDVLRYYPQQRVISFGANVSF